MTPNRISIAMAVYNGERFIREQLDSFVRQTRLPDELVVSDDGSTDRTLDLVRTFAATAPFEVRILKHAFGPAMSANFQNAISEARGDIIFTADCDDVWYPQKIELMMKAFSHCPEAGLVVCNAEMVDENLRPLGKTSWQHLRFHSSRRRIRKFARGEAFDVRLPALGQSMAFRAQTRSVFLPFPQDDLFRGGGWDYFIAWTVICSGVAGVALIPRPLLAWRRHKDSATADRSESRLQAVLERWQARRKRGLPTLPAVVRRLEELSGPEVSNSKIRDEALAHWRWRCGLPSSRWARIPGLAKELASLRYHRFSQGVRTAIRDLLLVE
jgi:Glycosyl transferase family 2